ncbi:helix-turn-helix transcriptional regulator [Daejeonella lutea]|uniref:Helix-turn-helix domain-containing protein n=1 Tax=Daejeonella lutea TaxID=572036 RepID=A0A1T4ZXX4_9SPHI|nr:helix-turn-helix transcriptional regulator [Daejeonella lutea]SKB27455.1 Helix-turn-helix domain-containing protein [Daejeonella lutea]
MDYKTFPPGIVLASIIKCYWTLRGPRKLLPQKQRIVPDGCMEMIFHLGDSYVQYLKDGSKMIQPKAFVFGQITSPLDIEPTGATNIFAVRFHPDGFTPLAGISIKNMDNRAVPLTELFENDGREVGQAISTAETIPEKIGIIEAFFLSRLSIPETIDRTVKNTVQEIINLKGQGSVEDLSVKMSVNRRQLERKFAVVVGLSPKQLLKIIRLQTALKLLQRSDSNSLTVIAHESEYYDQAHFIKDFKEFTGLSPKQFYSDNLKLTAFFSGID